MKIVFFWLFTGLVIGYAISIVAPYESNKVKGVVDSSEPNNISVKNKVKEAVYLSGKKDCEMVYVNSYAQSLSEILGSDHALVISEPSSIQQEPKIDDYAAYEIAVFETISEEEIDEERANAELASQSFDDYASQFQDLSEFEQMQLMLEANRRVLEKKEGDPLYRADVDPHSQM